MDKMQEYYEINLDLIFWDEKLWKKYLKKLKQRYRLFEPGKMGQLKIWSNQQDIGKFQIQVIVNSVLSEVLDRYRPIHAEVSGKRQFCILPLAEEPESCTYLFYSTRLAILQTNEQAREWLLQFFMDLRLFYHKNYINFLFLEEEIEQVLNLTPVFYAEVEEAGGVLDFIRAHVMDGDYLNIHLDEFYLSSKEYYQTRHFVHENLIYGFDDEKEEIYAYGMAERQQTEKYTISYYDFLLLYEKGKLFSFCDAEYLEQEGYAPVLLCRIGTIPEYHFTWEEMAKKLKAFINPKPEEIVGEDIHVYGKGIYAWIIRELAGETDYGIDDFRIFQLLYEQKQCICRRLRCLQERNMLPEKYQSILSGYQSIVQICQGMRIIYLKQLQREGALDNPIKRIADQEVRVKLANALAEMRVREEEALAVL